MNAKLLKLFGIDYVLVANATNNIIKSDNKKNSIKSDKIIINSNVENSSRYFADKAKTLEELEIFVKNFKGYELKKLAQNTVFSQGNPKSQILLIGEAPGATEDAQGIPFCGESGQLLDNIMASIGLSRAKNIYITNTIFWRPPANRTPTAEEVEICRPFVEKHIALINPELIILVGAVATSCILGKNMSINNARGAFHPYTNQYLEKPINATGIFHPAYLLRQPSKKKDMWYDILKIQKFIQDKNIL